MDSLKYPFDPQLILRSKKKLRRELLSDGTTRIRKKIAVLGGSTTAELTSVLELFLLDQGIEADFFESEYNRYWQDVMFDNPALIEFQPDLICVHTTSRNIGSWPELSDSDKTIEQKLASVCDPFRQMWDKIAETYHCPVIQNNFDRPWYRLLGNRDIWDIHGRSNFVNSLNRAFYTYARAHANF